MPPMKRKSARKKPVRAAGSNPPPPARRQPPRLIIAASEESADILYATKFFAPDAFLFLEHNGRTTVLLSDLEVDRGRKAARVDEVIGITEFSKEHKKVLGRQPTLARVAAHFLKTRRVRRAVVPGSFPLAMSMALAREGVTVAPPKKACSGPRGCTRRRRN